jgi:hypothetical protein
MALTPEAISAIDYQLELCDTTSITLAEVNYQNALGVNPVDECGYYLITQDVLVLRSKYDARASIYLDNLAVLAAIDSCPLTSNAVEPVDIDIPFFGGAIK